MTLLSRVAEALFWMGRYVERAENTARLLDVTYHGRLEPGHAGMAGATNTWEALITTLGEAQQYDEVYPEYSESAVVEFLTVSRENPSSICSSLGAARENARSARDFLSSETWVAINRLYHTTSRGHIQLIMTDGLYDFCDSIRQGAQLFYGTASSTSLHDEGWYWLRAGQLIERADMVTRIVDSKYHLLMTSLDEVGGALDRYQWAAVLRSVSGYEAFRRTHASGIEPGPVIEFLLLDRRFPRSLRAAIDTLTECLDSATEGAEAGRRNPVMRIITDLQNELSFETPENLLGAGLHEYLASTQSAVARLSHAVGEAFFWSTRSAA